MLPQDSMRGRAIILAMREVVPSSRPSCHRSVPAAVPSAHNIPASKTITSPPSVPSAMRPVPLARVVTALLVSRMAIRDPSVADRTSRPTGWDAQIVGVAPSTGPGEQLAHVASVPRSKAPRRTRSGDSHWHLPR